MAEHGQPQSLKVSTSQQRAKQVLLTVHSQDPREQVIGPIYTKSHTKLFYKGYYILNVLYIHFSVNIYSRGCK